MAKVYPGLFAPFFQEAWPKTKNLVSMGLVAEDINAQVSQSGEYFTIPFQENLSNIGNSVRVTTSTTITPQTLGDKEEVGVVCHIGQGIKEQVLNDILRGAEGLRQAANQIVPYTVNEFQRYLVSATKGAFAADGPLFGTHVVDKSGIGDGTISTSFIIDAAQETLGEDGMDFDALIMHSKIFADLQKVGLITYVNAGTFGQNLLVSGDIPTVLGKRVMVNDTLCAKDSADKYPVYLSGGRPWYLGYQRQQLRIYQDFNPAIGGGQNETYWYADFVPHIRGLKWNVSTINPTTTNLETGTNWTKVWTDENIKLAQLLVFAKA